MNHPKYNKEDIERFTSKCEWNGDCWEWQASTNNKGYGQFWFDGKMRRAHRVSWEIYCSVKPDDMFVLHSCDNPKCVNPEHLFLGTHLDNMKDMRKKNRGHKDTHNRKYSIEEQRKIVLESMEFGVGPTADKYNIDNSTVWNYKNNVKSKVQV